MKRLVKRLLKSCSFVIIFILIFIMLGNLIAYLSIFLNYDGIFLNANTEKINNIDIHYSMSGEGTPILLIHDINSSSIDFNDISNNLSKTNKVILIDLPGCGLSSMNTDLNYSKENLAKTCNDLMNKLGYSKYSIMGHSFGGNLSVEIARLYPNSVNKLILLSPNIFFKPNKTVLPSIILKVLKVNYFNSLIQYSNSFYNKKSINLDNFEQNFYYNSQKPNESFKKLYLTNIIFKDEELKNIHTPTLILWGMNDKSLPLADSYKLNDLLSNSKLVILSQTGHNPHLESKSVVVSEITNFIK